MLQGVFFFTVIENLQGDFPSATEKKKKTVSDTLKILYFCIFIFLCRNNQALLGHSFGIMIRLDLGIFSCSDTWRNQAYHDTPGHSRI